MLHIQKRFAIHSFIATFIFCWFFASPQNATAQKSEEVLVPYNWCLPDCPNDQWLPAFPATELNFTFNIGTCIFRVNYKYRTACDTWCDLQIRTIDNLSSDPSCAGYSMQTLIQIASVQLIQQAIALNLHNGKCTPQQPGDCRTSWRVSNATCWRYWAMQNPISGWYGSWGGCDQETCCLNRYTVCMDQYGQIIVTKVSSISNGPCIENPGQPCTNVCE